MKCWPTAIGRTRVLRTPRTTRCLTRAIVMLTLSIGGCGSEDVPGNAALPEDADVEASQHDYRVILAGAATDTLSGSAVFGYVVEPETGKELFVVKLETGLDVVGGLFVARGNRDLPEARSYALVNTAEVADSELGDRFKISYQEGLLRRLRSRQGTVTFSHVSDSLVAGSIEATLRGEVASGRGGSIRVDDVHVSGRFEAGPGTIGFVVGI